MWVIVSDLFDNGVGDGVEYTELIEDTTFEKVEVLSEYANVIMKKLNDGSFAEAGLDILQGIISDLIQEYESKITDETPTAMAEEYKAKVEVLKHVITMYNMRIIGEPID